MAIPIQETYRELPGVRQGQVRNPLNQQTATLPGRQLEETGRALSQTANTIADIALKEQEKANRIRLNDVMNQALTLAHGLRYNKDTGYLNLKGADAVKGVTDDEGVTRPIGQFYGDKLDKGLADIRKNLGNADLEAQFDVISGDIKTKFGNEAMSYEAEQSNVYAVQTQDATILTSGNELAADPFGRASAFHIDRARSAAVAKGQAAGLDGEALDHAVKASLGKMHSAVIDTLMEAKHVKQAKDYYAAHEGDFMELDAKNIKNKIDIAYDATEAIGAVNEVLSKYPLRNNQPAKRSDMDAMLRTKYADDPSGLKAARAELSQRISDHEFQETETNAGNVSAVWNMLLGGQSLASVESSSAWLSLPGNTRASLANSWDSYSTSKPISDEAWGQWLETMQDDEYLARVTPTQLAALEPTFGRQLTAQLSTQAGRVQAERSKSQAAATAAAGKIDNDLFNKIAGDMGYDPFTKDDKQKARNAQLRAALESGVAQDQAATGKIIPPGEMEARLRNMAATYVTRSRAAPWFDYARANPMLFPPDLVPQVSSAEGQAVARYMQEKGMEPTPENYRRALIDVFEAGLYLVDE